MDILLDPFRFTRPVAAGDFSATTFVASTQYFDTQMSTTLGNDGTAGPYTIGAVSSAWSPSAAIANASQAASPLGRRNHWRALQASVGVVDFESPSLPVGGGSASMQTTPIALVGDPSGRSVTITHFQPDFYTSPKTIPDIKLRNTRSNSRFNTTNKTGKGQWMEFAYALRMEFSAPVSAFSFYICDVGDAAKAIRGLLYDAAGGVETVYLRGEPGTAAPYANGALDFWGASSTTKQFTKLELQPQYPNLNPNPIFLDYYGIDDLTIGSAYADRIGVAPLYVKFTSLVPGAVAWAWEFFGDGNVLSTLENPEYVYGSVGTHTVKLTATMPDGSTSVATKVAYIDARAFTAQQTYTVEGGY